MSKIAWVNPRRERVGHWWIPWRTHRGQNNTLKSNGKEIQVPFLGRAKRIRTIAQIKDNWSTKREQWEEE